MSQRLKLQSEIRTIKTSLIDQPDEEVISIWFHPVWNLQVHTPNNVGSKSLVWNCENWLSITPPGEKKHRIPEDLPSILFGAGCEGIIIDEDFRQQALLARPEIASSKPNDSGSSPTSIPFADLVNEDEGQTANISKIHSTKQTENQMDHDG